MRILLLFSLTVLFINCQAANYFSASTGNWNSSSTWSLSCGGAGGAGVPGAGDHVTICSGHTVSVTANTSVTNVTISTGGILKTGTTGGGANRTVTINGIFTINDGATYIHNNTQTAANTVFAGSESFSANSNIQVDKWSDTTDSLCAGVNSNFGNLVFNWNTGLFLWKNSGLGSVRSILGNLTTNTGCATYLDNSSSPVSITIGGNLTVHDEFRVKTTNSGNTTINVGGTLSVSGSDGFFIGIYQADGDFTLNASDINLTEGTFYGIYNADGDAYFNVNNLFQQSGGSFIGIRNIATFTAGVPSFNIKSINFTNGYFIGNSSCNTSSGNIIFNVSGDITINFSDSAALFAVNRLATLSSTPTSCSLTMHVGGDVTITGANGEFNTNNGTGYEDITIDGKLSVNSGKVYFNVIPGFGSNGHAANIQTGSLELTGGTMYLSSETGTLDATVIGNTVVSGGILNVKGNKATASLTCNGNYSQTGGTMNLYNNSTVPSTDVTSVLCNGNFSQTGGIINFSNNTQAGNGVNILYINGPSYIIGNTGTMTRAGAGTSSLFGELRFNRQGTIAFSRNGNHNIQQVKQLIAQGCEVDVISGNVQVASHATAATNYFTIESGGVLSLRSNQLFSNATAANSGITVSDAGKLRTQHPSGLYNNSTNAAISNSGNMDFFLGSNSTIEYYGNATQILTGINTGIANGSQHKYGILEINFSGPANTSWVCPTAMPTAQTAVYIRNELKLTSGELNLVNSSSTASSNGRTITIENSSASAITRTAGYIKSEAQDMSGAVIWNISNGTYIVPFGFNSSEYIPLSFSTVSGIPSMTTFATYHTNADNQPWPPSITNLNSSIGLTPDNREATVDRFWLVSPSGASNANITFSYTGSELPSNPYNNASQMKAQRFNTASFFWDAYLPSQTANAYNVTVSSVSTFGTWALSNVLSPLPVELLYFNANRVDTEVLVSWATATEKENDHFIIERADKQFNKEAIGTVKGHGTTSERINYSFTDKSPLEGTSYYRLVQVDFNGNKWHSDWVAVDFRPAGIYIYPNPATDKAYIFSNRELLKTAAIYDSFGRHVLNAMVDQNLIDVSILKPGIYYINADPAGDVFKLIIK